MEKLQILETVRDKVFEKIEYLDRLISETRASSNDTKSSMGDKYETGREMLQQEINKLQTQLNEVNLQFETLKTITERPSKKVEKGTLMRTADGFFYISVAAGEIVYNGTKVFAISPESPLAKAANGFTATQQFELNKRKITIEEIW